MKITKIEPQAKTKGRYSIFVDDKFAFGISEGGLISNKLSIGQELTARQLDELKNTAKTDKIYNLALSLIMRRPRSLYEIEDYLRRKSVEPPDATHIIENLKQKGFIDDLDFAKRWVENRRLLKSTSKRKLEYELKQKRVDDSIIKQVLTEDETTDSQTLQQLVSQKRQQSRYQDNEKLMRYLAGQGYNYQDIKEALSDRAG